MVPCTSIRLPQEKSFECLPVLHITIIIIITIIKRKLLKWCNVQGLLGHLTNKQERPADTRVTRDSAVIPRWPSAAILDIIEPEITSFDLLTPKTLAYNETWSGSDAPFARYSPLNYTVTLKLRFGVTQGHQKWHYLIEHI